MGSARGKQGERAGAGAPPVAALGIIGQVASHLLINKDKINRTNESFYKIEATEEVRNDVVFNV